MARISSSAIACSQLTVPIISPVSAWPGRSSLTHSFDPSGIVSTFVSVTNEPHVLNGTSFAFLGNSNVVFSSVVVADSTGTVTYTNGVDYTLTGNADGSASLQRTNNSTIPDGSQVSVSYNYFSGSTSAGLNLAVAGDVVVEAGSMINAAGRGYSGGRGPGPGGHAGSPASGGGAGYGGLGGIGSSNAPGGALTGHRLNQLSWAVAAAMRSAGSGHLAVG